MTEKFDFVIINTDGACSGNPGPMAIAFILKFSDNTEFRHSDFLGFGTNNIAEYQAVLKALEYIKNNNIISGKYVFRSDSQLVVNQLNNKWRVRDPVLYGLKKKIVEICKEIGYIKTGKRSKPDLPEITFTWIPRDQNKQADRLASACFK